LFDTEDGGDKENFVISDAEPQSMAETVRQSGLAYSAGIALFAAVVFMMILGWGADLLLGTSPWGIVGGIIIGSLIGFIQFFRLTSQIFKK
jgi:F0F1-type ATP synthase assembly protein I